MAQRHKSILAIVFVCVQTCSWFCEGLHLPRINFEIKHSERIYWPIRAEFLSVLFLRIKLPTLRLRGGLPDHDLFTNPSSHSWHHNHNTTLRVDSNATDDDLIALDAPAYSDAERALLRAYLPDTLGFSHSRLHFFWWLIGLMGGALLAAVVAAGRSITAAVIVNIVACWALQYVLV